MTSSVGLRTGTLVRAVAARPDEVQIGPSRRSSVMGEVFRWSAPLTAWVSCETLSFERRSSRRDAMREAFGLPADMQARKLLADRRAGFATEPGGAPFLEIAPRDRELLLMAIDEHGEHTRVLLEDWAGVLVVGWTETANLRSTSVGVGALGTRPDTEQRTLDVCISFEPLPVHASAEGFAPEPVGSIDPHTRFVRRDTEGDTISVTPHPAESIRVPEGVTWRVRPSAPIVCGTEHYDPTADSTANAPED